VLQSKFETVGKEAKCICDWEDVGNIVEWDNRGGVEDATHLVDGSILGNLKGLGDRLHMIGNEVGVLGP
jgi:hypothetical protein